MLTTTTIDAALRQALDEDAPWGDITGDVFDIETSDAIRLCDEGALMEIDPATHLAPAPDGTPQLPFDPVKDLLPVSQAINMPNLLVGTDGTGSLDEAAVSQALTRAGLSGRAAESATGVGLLTQAREHVERIAVEDTQLAALDDVAAASVGAQQHGMVCLDHDGAVLGAEQRARGAHVQAPGVGAVLAHVRLHEPAEVGGLAGVGGVTGQGRRRHTQVDGRTRRRRDGRARHPRGHLLLDKGDVPPRGRPQRPGVVVTHPRQLDAVLGDEVPLLARHLAGLTPDTHGSVGEKGHAAVLVIAMPARVFGQKICHLLTFFAFLALLAGRVRIHGLLRLWVIGEGIIHGEQIIAGIQVQVRALLIFLEHLHTSLAARATARLDIAGADLGILDEYVRLQRKAQQIIGTIACNGCGVPTG